MSSIISNLSTYPPEIKELTLTNLSGIEFDLLNRFSSLNIDTDLFRSFIVVSVSFNDGIDVLKNLELLGGEDLVFKFKSRGSAKLIELNLKLYEVIGDKELSTHDKSVPIILNFVSPEKFIDMTKTICKKFNAVGSSIVKDILKNNLGSSDDRLINVNTTTETLELWCNYKNCFKFIAMLCNYDLNLLYEELDGFHYTNIDDMLSANVSEVLNLNTDNKSFTTFENIQKYQYNKLFNYLDMGELGFFGNRLENIDPLYYRVNRTNKTNTEITNSIELIGSSSLINSNYDDKNSKVRSINGPIENIQKMNHFFTAIHLYTMELEINGLTDRRVGNIIEFSNFGYDNLNTKNKKLSGRWIISNIVHVINRNSYKQRLTISKMNLGE